MGVYYGEGRRVTQGGWYSVRHVVRNAPHYEERITLWQAEGFDEAIAKAREEAARYVSGWSEESGVHPLESFQAFWLFAEPADGAEVFSLIRRSELEPDAYLERFVTTGDELRTDRIVVAAPEPPAEPLGEATET